MFKFPFPGKYRPGPNDWFQIVWIDIESEKIGWIDTIQTSPQESRFTTVRRWANESVYEEPVCLV